MIQRKKSGRGLTELESFTCGRQQIELDLIRLVHKVDVSQTGKKEVVGLVRSASDLKAVQTCSSSIEF